MALKKQLTTPYPVYAEIVAVKYTNFAYDTTNSLIHIGYSTLQAGNIPYQEDIPITLSGVDYTNFIARINELNLTALSGSEAQAQTVLEYCPGVGTISGDIKTLTTSYIIDDTVMGQEIDSNAENDIDQILLVGYSLLNTPTTSVQNDLVYTLTGQEYANFVTRFNELSETIDATQAKTQALLESLPGDGTIVDI